MFKFVAFFWGKSPAKERERERENLRIKTKVSSIQNKYLIA